MTITSILIIATYCFWVALLLIFYLLFLLDVVSCMWEKVRLKAILIDITAITIATIWLYAFRDMALNVMVRL